MQAADLEQAKTWEDRTSLWFLISMLSSKTTSQIDSVSYMCELQSLTIERLVEERREGERERSVLERRSTRSLLISDWKAAKGGNGEQSRVRRISNMRMSILNEYLGESKDFKQVLTHRRSKAETDIRAKADIPPGLKLHEALILFKMNLDLRVVQLRHEKSDPLVTDEDVLKTDYGAHGDIYAHICLLLWEKRNPEFHPTFNLEWTRNLSFLRQSVAMSFNMRLLLWMISYCNPHMNCWSGKQQQQPQEFVPPSLVNARYTSTTTKFEGQTLLHMAVVREDLGLVRFLVNIGANVHARATGSFFQEAHFGSSPLSFAVRMGSFKMVDYLLAHFHSRLHDRHHQQDPPTSMTAGAGAPAGGGEKKLAGSPSSSACVGRHSAWLNLHSAPQDGEWSANTLEVKEAVGIILSRLSEVLQGTRTLASVADPLVDEIVHQHKDPDIFELDPPESAVAEAGDLVPVVDPVCDKDEHGNSVLHLCVLTENLEMYNLLVDVYHLNQYVINHDNLTPLSLAAALGDLTMFEHLLARRRKMLWSYGNIACAEDPLTEHESAVQHSAAPSTLEVIVRRDQTPLMANHFLTLLIQEKWQRIRWAFWSFFALFLFSSMTFMTFLKADEVEGRRIAQKLTFGFSSFWMLSMLSIVFSIYSTIVRYFYPVVKTDFSKVYNRVHAIKKRASILESQDSMRFVAPAKQDDHTNISVDEIFVQVSQKSKSLMALFSTLSKRYRLHQSIFFLWLYSLLSIVLASCTDVHTNSTSCSFVSEKTFVFIQMLCIFSNGLFLVSFFLAGLQLLNVGFYVLIVWKCFWKVIVPYAVLYFFLMMPAALMLNLIYQHAEEEVVEFGKLHDSMSKLFSVAMIGMEYTDFELGGTNIIAGLPATILMGFTVLVYVLLLNSLIAVLSTEVEHMQRSTELQSRMQQARLIIWFEQFPLSWLHKRFLQVGMNDPAPDPFASALERVNESQRMEYQAFSLVVTLNRWRGPWEDHHTLLLKRLVLDSCMLKPTFFPSLHFPHLDFFQNSDSLLGSVEIQPAVQIDVLPEKVELKLLDQVLKKQPLGRVPEYMQLRYVTHDLDQKKTIESMMKKLNHVQRRPTTARSQMMMMQRERAAGSLEAEAEAAARQHEPLLVPDDSTATVTQELDIKLSRIESVEQKGVERLEEGVKKSYRESIVGMPLWRNGCVVEGGGPNQVHFNKQDPDAITVELRLHVPANNHWWSFLSLPHFLRFLSHLFFSSLGSSSSDHLASAAPDHVPVERICDVATILERLGSNKHLAMHGRKKDITVSVEVLQESGRGLVVDRVMKTEASDSTKPVVAKQTSEQYTSARYD